MNIDLIEGGKLQENLFSELKKKLKPKVSFFKIYDFISEYFKINMLEIIPGSIPVTINLNNIVYHGRPGSGCLQNGEVVTIDVCFSYKGLNIDGAATFPIGTVTNDVNRLIEVNKALIKGVLDIIDVGVSVKQIIRFLSDYITEKGYFILPHGMGHGIGDLLHQKPLISLNDFTDFEYEFKQGDLFTIEPIILLRKDQVYENILGEGITSDHNISSQFEIMIYIQGSNSLKILNEGLLN